MAGVEKIAGAGYIQMVNEYKKEYCHIVISSQSPLSTHRTDLTIPEWIHIRRSPTLRGQIENNLVGVDINFDSPKDICVHHVGYERQNLVHKIADVLTAIRQTLEIQVYRIPTQHHSAALKQLQLSDAYKTGKGTFWKSYDGIFVFVVNKETRDGFDEFLSIICSLQSEDKRENSQTIYHHLQREVREMGEEAFKVLTHFSDKLTPSEMKALRQEDKRIRNFVIKKIEEKGTSCSFDFKSGTVEFCSEENEVLQTKIYFHSLFDEVSRSMKGSSVLKGYSLEEICDNIYASLGSTSELVVIIPERDHQITIFGVAEYLKRAEETLKYYMREFSNADIFQFQVPVETVSDALWKEITCIAENLPEGKIKVLPPDFDPQSVCAFGRKECITEFQRRVKTLCSLQKKEFPIMEPHLSLLKAKGDVVSYLTEEAKQKNIELEVELEKKRYSVAFRCYQQTEVEAFLHDWCKVIELKDVQRTEKTKEKIESDLKTYGSEIYNRVLLKVHGSAIHLITTADDFDRVTAFLRKWKKFDEEKKTSERETPIPRQPSQTSRSSAESSHPGTDSSAAASASSSAAATSASTSGDNDNYDELITQSADGSIKFSCKLGYTLAEYCSRTYAFRQLVVEEFKTHGFEIQIDRDCKKAVTALSNEKDKAKVKHILTSFGARQFNLSESNCCLTARELRDRVSKDKSSVRDKTIRIYVPADQNVLMVFGLKWQMDVLCPRLMDMIDDFEVQTFSISLASDLKENDVKRKLEIKAKKMQPWKMVFENKVLKVEIAKSNLEEFRTVVYDLLEDMNEMNPEEEILKASFSVSQQMLDFLRRKKILKELKDHFKEKNLSFTVEKCIRFRTVSYRSLKQADALFKSCVSVTRHDFRSKPIGVMLQGEELTNIFEQREELVVFVDDAHVLNVICLSHVLQQVEQALEAVSDEYDEDTVRVSSEDFEIKMDPEILTSEIYELDRTLIGQVKVLVDGESVRIVAKRNLLPHAKIKVMQILLRIENENEINCHNPHCVLKLDRLQVQLMEKPGIQENIKRKMEEQHFQVLYDFKEGQVAVYGLTEKFVQNGKLLFESFFKKIELPIPEDSVLKDHDFGALEEMVNDQSGSTVVVETDAKKRTLIMVCISDDYAFVQKIIEEMKFVDAQVVHCREETVVYIERFLAEKLHEICGKDICIKKKLDGVNSELKIAGRKEKMLKAKAEIEKLCSRVAVQESPVDENVFALDKAQKNSSLSEIEAQFQCVIGIDEQGSTGQTNEQPATSANECLNVEEADLSKLKTDAIALMFAERKLPNLIESSLKQAGVYDQFTKMVKMSQVMPSGVESVVFGEKKMLKCDHIAFCKMPYWESQGQSKQKEVVRTTTQCLLEDCMRRKVSEVSIVIAVENSFLFRRIAKQVIFEVMNTLKKNHGTFSFRVQLITWDQPSTSKLRELLREAWKFNDQVKPKRLQNKMNDTWKGNQTKGGELTRGTTTIVIAGKSDDVCKRALKRVNQVCFEMSKFLSLTETYFTEDVIQDAMGHTHISGSADLKPQDYTDSNGAVRLSRVFCEHPMWDKTRAEISKRGIEVTEKPDCLILKGSFEKLAEGINVIHVMCQIIPYLTKTLDKSPISELSPEKAFVVSEDHFMAVEHLVGKQEIAKCFVVKDKPPSEKQIFFRNFHHNEEKRAEAENIELRIKGVIQEEVQFPETERQKAAEKVNAMSKSSDMFLLYKPDRNVIVIYTEDWQKMYGAKKKVQSKAPSRECRRFASQPKTDIDEDKPPTSTSSTSPIVTEDTDRFKGKTITVRVYKADITKLDLDVIVNAANGRLGHGGGVSRAIAKAAGPSLTREGDDIVNKFGQISVTDLAVTTAGSLPCKKVFHAVGPQWTEGSTKKQDQCQLDLCLTILRCLCQAENLEMRSIAIPPISGAIFRVSQHLCARAYVRALKIFDEISEGVYLKEVHFVDPTDAMVREIQSACRAVWNTPVDSSQCDTEREFMKMCLETRKTSPKANESKEPTDILGQVDFFSGNPFTKSADAIVSWESHFAGSSRSTISGFLKIGGIKLEEERKKALGKWSKYGDVETRPGGQLPVKYVVYTLVPSAVRSNELLDYLRTVLSKTTSMDSLVIPVLKDLAQGSGKDWKVMFVEGLVQALQEYSKSNPNKRKILIFAESDTDLQDVQKRYKEHVNSISLQQVTDECVICLEPITKPSKLKCGHVFCEGCIRDAFKFKPVCPICKKTCGEIRGNMPYGIMDVSYDWLSLPGYEKYKRITIQYNFPGGTQSASHPNPGKPFRGARRTAYLPASPEGHEVLQLLRVAWDRKLTFTIGQSVTIGDGIDRVTWNEICHKTNLSGGEINYGYPDPGYLKRVKEELAAQGVTVDDLGATASTQV